MSPQVSPPPPLLERFDSVIRALGERVYACREESCALAALRDTLLPSLISGELRVKDTGRVVEII